MTHGYDLLSGERQALIDGLARTPGEESDYDAGYGDGQRELREELGLADDGEEIRELLDQLATIVRWSSAQARQLCHDVAHQLGICLDDSGAVR